jgi:hypothetical protein
VSINLILPFVSTAIMIVFAASVLQRWVVRRSTYFLFWGLGLAMFGAGSFAEAYLAVAPFNRVIFFVWYVFGAALNAGWIGQGTLMLLVRKPWVRWATASLLIGGSLVVVGLMLSTPLDPSKAVQGQPVSVWYRDVMPPAGQAPVRLTTPFFNIYGLITLVGGALWSGYLFWRKRVLPNRVVGNVLIAIGALAIGSASILTRYGIGQFLYIGELIAATLMYVGFRSAAAPVPARTYATSQVPAPQPNVGQGS